MDVVRHQMSFFNPAFLLACKFAEYLPKVHPQLAVQHLATALWDEDDVVFAIPRCVAQTLELVHRGVLSSRVLGGSRGKSPRWALLKMSNFYCLPGRAGGTPLGFSTLGVPFLLHNSCGRSVRHRRSLPTYPLEYQGNE